MEQTSLKEMNDTLIQVRLDLRELTTEVRALRDLSKKVDDAGVMIVLLEGKMQTIEEKQKQHDSDAVWLKRLVYTFAILGVLNAAFEVSKLGG